MLKKVLSIAKGTIIVWLCILFPLIIGFGRVKSSAENDIKKYMDSYLDAEATGLSKYIGLQLKSTGQEITDISNAVIIERKAKAPNLERVLLKAKKSNSDILDMGIYNKYGQTIAKLNKNTPDSLGTADSTISELKDGDINFSFQQLDDGNIVLVFILYREQTDKKDDFYLAVTMKWSHYESFLERIQVGAFPRKFYIISPDCKRYISLNSLPHGEESNRNLVALGLHLADQINSIATGISDVKLEDLTYRMFKSAIKIPEKMDGNQMFIISVTDDEAFEILSKAIFSSGSTVILVLICLWLLVCIVIARIVTDLKERLEISDSISNSTPSATVVFDMESGKISRINPSGLTLLRLSPEKTPEVNTWSIFPSAKDKDYIANAIKSNMHIVNYEVLVQSFAGNSFWSVCSANPLVIDRGLESKIFVVLSIMDINRRKEIEKKLANNAELLEKQVAERTADLEEKAKELEKSNKLLDQAKLQADSANAAKTKFLTNMSAELKTPINAIIGYSEILQEEAIDRKDNVSADDLTKIIGSAKHLLSLINEILDLSSIESGKTQLFFENIKIPTLMKEIEGVSMPLITEHENSFFSEYPKGMGEMFTDQTKLRQCLLNLIENAAKFTEFGKITLRASPIVKNEEDFIEFSVTDTGRGIEADRLDSIFSFQEDTSKSSGTGLGLAITKKYVECMGGTISVESEIGVGSKFIIKLPKVCKVVSSDTVEVKNQRNEEALDEFIEEAEEDIEQAEEADYSLTTGAPSGTRTTQ